MNVNAITKKLQAAILHEGMAVAISRDQFYSDDQKRFIPITTISTPIYAMNRKGEWKDRNYIILRTSSQTDILLCLVEIYRALARRGK